MQAAHTPQRPLEVASGLALSLQDTGAMENFEQGATWSELCWSSTDSGKSGRGLNGLLCQATWGEALGIHSPAKLPGKRSQEESAFVAGWSAEEDAGTAEPPLAEKWHQ